MKNDIRSRVIEAAEYIASTGATVRACAHRFCVSKSTIHKDMRARLPLIDPELTRRVDKVLGINRAERHIRGGMATRRKYIAQKNT